MDGSTVERIDLTPFTYSLENRLNVFKFGLFVLLYKVLIFSPKLRVTEKIHGK